MKKQYAWDQVDRLAEEWYATPAGEEHAAIKQKLLEEFLGLSCNLLSESMMEGLGDFWEQDFQRFDPALFQAAKLPFLDFFLDRVCRTVPCLASSETRPYGQLVEGRPDEPVEQPLPQDVYRSYLAREEGRRAGLSAISQQRTAYRAFLKRMLQC